MKRSLLLLLVGAVIASGCWVASASAQSSVRERVESVPLYALGPLAWGGDGRAWAVGADSGTIGRAAVRNGALRWSKVPLRLSGATDWRDLVVGRDGDLYLLANASPESRQGQGRLVRVDSVTGRMRWSKPVGAPGWIGRGVGREAVRLVSDYGSRLERRRLEGFAASGRRLSRAEVPGTPVRPSDGRALATASDGTAIVVARSADRSAWRMFRRTRGRWVTELEVPFRSLLSSVAPAAGGGHWFFSDLPMPGGSARLWQPDATPLRELDLATGVAGTTSARLCAHGFRSLYGDAGLTAGDGALWLRAHCVDDENDVTGPVWWVSVRPNGEAADAALSSAAWSSDVGRDGGRVISVTNGPDGALWSVDGDAKRVLHTELPTPVVPLQARVVSAHQAGRLLRVRLSCVAEPGRVCAGELLVRSGNRTVRRGRYFVQGGPAGTQPQTTRTFSARGLRGALRVQVKGTERRVRVR